MSTSAIILIFLSFECSHCVCSQHGQTLEQTNSTVYSGAFQTDYSSPNTGLQQMAAKDTEAVPTCSSSCGPWFHCQSGRCQPGPPLPSGVLSFDNKSVLDCYCVTYNKFEDSVEIGKCIFNCMRAGSQYQDSIYSNLPSNVSDLNKMFCEKFNRQGTLCGQCKDDHFPLAYSFNLTCVKCPHSKTNWIKYVSVAFVPLTVFYFVILLFKVNIVSSHLYGFVVYSQAVTIPALSRILILSEHASIIRIVGLFYSIWNLDFFRLVNLQICLETSFLLNLALDLLVAVYPLLLMIVTYLMIHLYDHSFRPLVLLWRPFGRIFSLFRDKWDIRSSVIDSFATFFLLSNIKFLSVAYDLLNPVEVYQLSSSGNFTHTWSLYYDSSIPYFGSTHLPYAILAIVVLAVFALLPVLILMLYPFRFFQKILNALPVRWHVLHTFMDSFLGCYKDGTEPGTRDCRWFASVFFIFRYVFIIVSIFATGSSNFPISAVIVTIFVLLLVIVQPFKAKFYYYSTANSIFMLFLALCHASITGILVASTKYYHFSWLFYVVSMSLGILPLLYVSLITLKWIIRHRKFGLDVFRRWQATRNGYEQLSVQQ